MIRLLYGAALIGLAGLGAAITIWACAGGCG